MIEIAGEAEFFSFGTNDLTQMTYGMSRDDAGPFLMPYIQKDIYREDPTVSIDQTGVGRLMQICVDDARKVNANIKLGICQAGRRPGLGEVLRQAGADVCLVLAQARAGRKAGGGAGGAGEQGVGCKYLQKRKQPGESFSPGCFCMGKAKIELEREMRP